MKKILLFMLSVVAILIISGCTQNDISPETTSLDQELNDYEICEPDWQCGEWSECVGPPPLSDLNGIRFKGCTDLNLCGNKFVAEGIATDLVYEMCENELKESCIENMKMIAEECDYTVSLQPDLNLCQHMNRQFSCNVFDISSCGSIYDKMNRGSGNILNNYEVVGMNDFIPFGVSCHEGEYVGENVNNLYCVLWKCAPLIDNDGTIMGYGGLFGLGEYVYTYQKSDGTNIYIYTLVSCAENMKVFNSETECIYYVAEAERVKRL